MEKNECFDRKGAKGGEKFKVQSSKFKVTAMSYFEL
jgi:hypothetical protein